jgi:hypothetical protein
MPVESDNDRLAILNDFGIEAEINGRTIIGILDNQYEDANGMAVHVPVFTVRMIDMSNVSRGDSIHIDDPYSSVRNYTVAEIQDDGQGIGHVILQKV